MAYKLESLDRATERIKAIADDAEKERQKEVEKIKKQVQDFFDRTGKKRKYDYESVPGGARAVEQLLAPTTKAIGVATREYRKALVEQSQETT